MRGVPYDVDECLEYGRAPFPTKVLYAELRGRRVAWCAGETAADAVHRAAQRRRIRRTVAEIGGDLTAAVELDLVRLDEDGEDGGEVTFVALPPSVERQRAARDAVRAAARARAASRRDARGPRPQGGLTEAERKDKARHPEKYADREPGRPGRPRRDSSPPIPDETRDTTRDSSPGPVTVFRAVETRDPSGAPAPEILTLSGPPQGGPREERPDPDARPEAAGVTGSDAPVSRVGGLRSAAELAAEKPAVVGQFLLDVFRARAPNALPLRASDEDLAHLGRVIVAEGSSEADLRAIGGRWQLAPAAARAALSWDNVVDAGHRVKLSLLLGRWDEKHQRFKGTGFKQMRDDALNWLEELVAAGRTPSFKPHDPPFRDGHPRTVRVGPHDVDDERDTGSG